MIWDGPTKVVTGDEREGLNICRNNLIYPNNYTPRNYGLSKLKTNIIDKAVNIFALKHINAFRYSRLF